MKIRKYRADISNYSRGIFKDFFFLSNAKKWIKEKIGTSGSEYGDAMVVYITDRRSGKSHTVRNWYPIANIEMGSGYTSISLPLEKPKDNYDYGI
jgi:hypothetical protein